MARKRPHPHDVLLAAAGWVGGVALWALGLNDSYHGLPRALTLIPLTVMACTTLLRRTAPRAALAIGTVVVVVDQTTVPNVATVILFADVIYAAALYAPLRTARRVAPGCVAFTILTTVIALSVMRDVKALIIGIVAGLVTVTSAWTGWIIRTHRDEAAAERLRAEQTALLAELDRRSAVEQERARMARELHDVVANHLSAIAIHSTAAMTVAKGDPEATSRALGVIRESSVQGLAEMRRLIGLLRNSGGGEAAFPGDHDGAQAAVPRLDSLDAMLARASRSGAGDGLEFSLDDRRLNSGSQLPAPVELAAFRIVQESLTNALKHAAPGLVTVRLVQSTRRLVVAVESPYTPGDGPRAPGAGAGLVGMRERASLLGGSFEAGPRTEVAAGRGTGSDAGSACWQVRAELPLGDPDETESPRQRT
ncbi:sensor histidine kinase [Yinghuangia sp. YIM S09857]|uniref:sensor histidine kinase n=1 Tax=Yinghuangia sp. YIM S09857 TaxID=3436929 RepID=UPI003F52E678